ncbi:Protein MANBAL [Folsomia candida]|uniref:Protein MANBAL n=1 Tax=Folsomia candida TaxID=158441 RepID=A0A226DC64_FOLCA|nr:Protein MANBAL [Folsomia candida]
MMEVQEDIVDTFLRYGLFIGAVFQLLCIGAVIVMPDSKSTLFHVALSQVDEGQSSNLFIFNKCVYAFALYEEGQLFMGRKNDKNNHYFVKRLQFLPYFNPC